MTPNPTVLPSTATVGAAAKAMRDQDIGDVVVLDDGRPSGIVTDRDLVVRALAGEQSPQNVALAQICSRDLTVVSPSDDLDQAVELMRKKGLRRLPVVNKEVVVGIVSIGDLAKTLDPDSTLAEISRRQANR